MTVLMMFEVMAWVVIQRHPKLCWVIGRQAREREWAREWPWVPRRHRCLVESEEQTRQTEEGTDHRTNPSRVVVLTWWFVRKKSYCILIAPWTATQPLLAAFLHFDGHASRIQKVEEIFDALKEATYVKIAV